MARELLQFGDFEFDAAALQLKERGLAVRLQRVPLDILVLLLTRRGELVTRQEITDQLWSDDPFIDVEASVNTAIRKVRRALGDDPAAPRYVETVTGRGYRFIAPVQVVRSQTQADGGERLRIAVLPVQNLAAEADDEYLAEGLTDDLITAAGQLDPRRLAVIARTSSMSYKGTTKDAATIGRELGVQYLVEGTVRRAGAESRVTARLIRVEDQTQIWSGAFDGNGHEHLAVRSGLAGALAEELRTLAGSLPGAVQRPPGPNPAAYDMFLRGRFHWWQLTPEAVRRAGEYFASAIEADPGYAQPHAWVSYIHANRPLNSDARPLDELPRAIEAAERALSLDSDLADGHRAVGLTKFWFEWDWSSAEYHFRRAAELQPTDSLAHMSLAHLMSNSERFEESVAHLNRTIALDPLSPFLHAMAGQILFQNRDYTGAMGHVRQALSLDHQFWIGHLVHAKVLQELGLGGQALDACQQAFLYSGGSTEALSQKGWILASLGREDEAHQVLATLREVQRLRFVPPYNVALVLAALNDVAGALESLEEGRRERDPHLVFLPVDPKWDHLRADSKFQSFLGKCGF